MNFAVGPASHQPLEQRPNPETMSFSGYGAHPPTATARTGLQWSDDARRLPVIRHSSFPSSFIGSPDLAFEWVSHRRQDRAECISSSISHSGRCATSIYRAQIHPYLSRVSGTGARVIPHDSHLIARLSPPRPHTTKYGSGSVRIPAIDQTQRAAGALFGHQAFLNRDTIGLDAPPPRRAGSMSGSTGRRYLRLHDRP